MTHGPILSQSRDCVKAGDDRAPLRRTNGPGRGASQPRHVFQKHAAPPRARPRGSQLGLQRIRDHPVALLPAPAHGGVRIYLPVPCWTQLAACQATRRASIRGGSAWACSSAGRAPRSQCGGRRFDPVQVHHSVFLTWEPPQGGFSVSVAWDFGIVPTHPASSFTRSARAASSAGRSESRSNSFGCASVGHRGLAPMPSWPWR